MGFWEKIGSFDRRYIFILIALTVIVPLLIPIGMPITITKEVKSVYDYIDELPPGSAILVSMDFDPAALAELYPMSIAVLKHAYTKKVRVIGMTLWITGTSLGDIIMREAAEGIAEQDKDYTYLGFVPSGAMAIMRMGEDITAVFKTDYNQKPISQIPAMRGIKNYKDISLIIDLAAGSTPEAWIAYAGSPHKVPIAAGVTAVSAVGYYPYLNAGQIVGLIGGMKGAAEYEKLVQARGRASIGMDSQSMAHLAIILLIIIANISYFVVRRKSRRVEET
ncbi:TPA: hypothetical protein ENX78_15300 [Candidatus Poribacteria bacterium]|nr:hypothetical protein [Candidatus Poribacteria bacterium]